MYHYVALNTEAVKAFGPLGRLDDYFHRLCENLLTVAWYIKQPFVANRILEI